MAMVVLGVLLLVLKLAEIGPFGQLSNWWVGLPFGLAVLWWYWADSSGWTKRREIDKMEARKRGRREKNLEALGMDAKSRRQR